jgi:site-specific recombinase XerD
MKHCGPEDFMERFVKDSRTIQRFRSGQFGPHIQLLAEELSRQGYAPHSIHVRLCGAHKFGQWLARSDVDIANLTAGHAAEYVARFGCVKRGDATTVRMLLDLLLEKDIIRQPVVPNKTEREVIADNYSAYLLQQRALSPGTIEWHHAAVRLFLSHCFGENDVILSAIGPKDVSSFVRFEAARKSAASAKQTTSAMRSFLNYLQYSGFLKRDISSSVPSVASWRYANIPKGLTNQQVNCVLESCDRKTAIGRRDYAILLLLARLGLRSAEVGGLTLDDIDWTKGTVSVCGKGAKPSRLPLPPDVGEAIAAYLRNDRPTVSSRRIFLRIPAPHIGFKRPNAVSLVVKYALKRAGIHTRSRGAHQFRHALATDMLKNGAALAEIGQVLRHSLPKTTFIYTKVDVDRLLPLAQPWPGGVA